MFLTYTGSDPRVLSFVNSEATFPEEVHGDKSLRELAATSQLSGLRFDDPTLTLPEVGREMDNRAIAAAMMKERERLAVEAVTLSKDEFNAKYASGEYSAVARPASVYSSAGYLLANEGFDGYDKHAEAIRADRFLALKEHTEKRLAERVGEASTVGGWTDLLFGSLLDELPFIGGADYRTNVGSKLLYNLAIDTRVPIDEATRLLDEAIDKEADVGFLMDWNPIRAQAMYQNMVEYGEGPEAWWDNAAVVLTTGSLAAPVAGKLIRTIGTARTPIQQVSATAGKAAGRKITEEAFESATDDDVLSLGALNAVLPSFASIPEAGIHNMLKLNTSFGLSVERNMSMSDDLIDALEGTSFARGIDPDKLAANYGSVVEKAKANVDKADNLLDIGMVSDKLDNLHLWMYYGKKGGGAYQSEMSAKAELKRLFNVNPKEAEKWGWKVFYSDRAEGWVIATTKNVHMDDFQKGFNSKDGLWNVLGEVGRRYVFSTGSALTKELQGLATQGEMAYGKLVRDVETRVNAWKKTVSAEEQRGVDHVLTELRDGELKHFRNNLTREQFDKHYPGSTPSKAAYDYYRNLVELNDTVYYYSADGYFKDAIKAGYDSVLPYSRPLPGGTRSPETRFIVKKVASPKLEDGEELWDTGLHKTVTSGTLPKNRTIYEVRSGWEVPGTENKVRYISAPSDSLTRNVSHQDILGYNPGGPRTTKKNNFVVAQVNESRISGTKRKFSSNPTIALATFTRGQAVKALKEIKAINKAILDELGDVKDLTRGQIYQRIKSVATNAEKSQRMNAAIRANNGWHTDIEDVLDYVKFMEDEVALDIRKDLGVASKNDRLTLLDSEGNLGYAGGGQTFGDRLFELRNAPWDGQRRDRPIRGYGGNTDQYDNPIASIMANASRRMRGRAYQAYERRAFEAVVVKNMKYIENGPDIAKMPPRQALRLAVIKSDEPEARRVRDALEAVKRTLKINEDLQPSYMTHKMRNLEEFVLDKFGKEVAISSSNPIDALRKMAFHAKLAFFAVDQLVVQSSQVLQILAITANRPGVILDLAGIAPIRAMASGVLSKNTKNYMAKKTYKLLGFDSADEMVAMSDWLYNTGRLEIAHAIAETAEGAQAYSSVIKGRGRRIEDASRWFFDQGEKIPRVYSGIAAWKEWKILNPKIKHSDPRAQAWMADRMDKLTYQMSSVSAASWQRNLAAVPLQFMTYTARVAESLFSDAFTKAERARILTGNLLMFGAGSAAMDSWLNQYTKEGEMDPGWYRTFKYGLVDYLTRSMGFEEWSISQRLSPAEGIFDLMESWNRKSFFEVSAGPSGQLAKDLVGSLISIVAEVPRGNYTMTTDSVKGFVRNLSSANRFYQASVIAKNGEYLRRDGNLDATVDDRVAGVIAVLSGFSNYDVLQGWDQVAFNKRKDEFAKEAARRMRVMFREMKDAYDSGDEALARKLSGQASFEWRAVKEANLEDKVQRELERTSGALSEMIRDAALRAGSAIGGGGELYLSEGE